MAQRDVVLRWIEQLGRLVARLMGRAGTGDLDLARGEIDAALAALLGPLEPLLAQLDPVSGANLLADAERIFAWAQLLDLSAVVDAAAGRPQPAAHNAARARRVAAEALAHTTEPRPEWALWLAERSGLAADG